MPTKKKTPEKRRHFVNEAVHGFVERLNGGLSLSDKEVALFATLLQTVDNDTLQSSIVERMEGWERRLVEMENFLNSRMALQQATQPSRRAGHQGPPKLNPLDDNHRR